MSIIWHAENLYLSGFISLQLFIFLISVLRQSGLSINIKTTSIFMRVAAMEFMPLMVTSVYCAVGLAWAYLRLSIQYLRSS